MAELGLKIPDSEQNIGHNPYMLCGFGVNSYFDILNYMSIMMVCITIFSIPLFFMYSRERGFAHEKSYPISKFFMGNLGGSNMFCSQFRNEKKQGKL